MKISVEEIDSIKRKIKIELPESYVNDKINAIYKNIQKNVKIKGFRPGKTPKSVLERFYKDAVIEDASSLIIKESFIKAIDENKLHIVSEPIIDKGILEENNPYSYTAIVEVKPSIELKDYCNIEVEVKKSCVTEEDIGSYLKKIQNEHCQLKVAEDERIIQKGDFVVIDFEGYLDGFSLDKIKGKDVMFEVGTDTVLREIEEGVIGLKKNSSKEVIVKLQDKSEYSELAGKDITIKVNIKEVKVKLLPEINDGFAKEIGGYESLEELKEKLRKDLEEKRDAELSLNIKNSIKNKLIEMHQFETPPSLIESQTNAMIRSAENELKSKGLSFEKLDENIKSEYKIIAEKIVKASLILEEIASKELISVDDIEVDNRIREIAVKIKRPHEEIKGYYEKHGTIEIIKDQILEDKTLDFLIKRCKINFIE